MGSLILTSDGILDKISEKDICALAEESKLQCPGKVQTREPDSAIPLRGETLRSDIPSSPSCIPLRLGIDLDIEEGLLGVSLRFVPRRAGYTCLRLGLRGCIDCESELSCQILDTEVFQGFGSPEDRIAAVLVKEAFNRRSPDNLAATVLNLTPA